MKTYSLWKSLVFIGLFFLITPITIGTSLFSLFTLTETQTPNDEAVKGTVSILVEPESGAKVFASLPETVPTVSGYASVSDARGELIKQYLEYYDSPLAPYAYFIVEMADEHGLDYRLLTAVAQQESNLCKRIPPLSYNCWGWGIHSEGTLGFKSYEQGIEIVSQGLRENYVDEGFTTIEEIMSKYTPLSSGSWAKGVLKFMGDIE